MMMLIGTILLNVSGEGQEPGLLFNELRNAIFHDRPPSQCIHLKALWSFRQGAIQIRAKGEGLCSPNWMKF